MFYQEPTHDSTVRTTATSKAEQRLKVDVGGKSRRRRKRKAIVKKIISKNRV